MEENKSPTTRRRRRGNIIFPLLLIFLGAFLLLRNVGIVEGSTWATIWRLWPVLLILIGLDGVIRQSGLAGGLLTIGLGVVFLLSNFQLLDINIWQLILLLWPLVLVAAGFDLIFGRRSYGIALIGGIIFLAVLSGATWFAVVRPEIGTRVTGQEINQPIDGADKAVLTLKPAVGWLVLDNDDTPGQLVHGIIPNSKSSDTRQSYQVTSAVGRYNLEGGPTFVSFPGIQLQRNRWELGITSEIPLELNISMGAGEADLDLSDLVIRKFDLSMGAGLIEVDLPEGSYTALIKGAVGSMVIVLPAGMDISIELDSGLSSVEIPKRFQKQDNRYVTAGYQSATERITLRINQAIGSISIREK